MFSFFNIAPYALIVVLAGAGYHYYEMYKANLEIQDLQERIAILTSNNEKLILAAEQNQNTITSLREQMEAEQGRLKTLQDSYSDIVSERDRYLSIFRRHNLTALARAKPGLIEPRVNNGTAEVFTDLEQITEQDVNNEKTADSNIAITDD